MKKLYFIIASLIFFNSCSEQETEVFEIPDDYVAPTHFIDEYGETYVTSAAISTATELIDDYEYVDLGLSVKWARVNLGASSPEEFGDYYAWGETETKDEYTEDNSVTYGDENIEDYSGYKKYDAATANWGNYWRTPTETEFQELIDNCEYEFVKYNDVYGCLFTADNGESIFLPEAGYYQTSSFYDGYWYWTSTPSSSSSTYATAYKIAYSSSVKRSTGGIVRPVTDGEISNETVKDIQSILDEPVEKLYLVGLNDVWDEYDFKLFASNSDNEWEYQGIAAVSSCSSGYSIYLDKDNNFNTFGSDTGVDDGSLSYRGSENIPFDNTGVYIWTVDLANFTYSYTEVTTVSYCGFNNSNILVSMTQDSDNPYVYAATIKISSASTTGGKIVLNGNTNYYVGGSNGTLEYFSTITNDAYLSKGTYTLTINFLDMTYSFTDEDDIDVTCTIDGYEYVDLGLPSGLKWATVNIGATLPADYGNYYAYGETETKSYFSTSNYSLYSSTKFKYWEDTEYDAAYVNWSSSWHMPVSSDYSELLYYCYWEWNSQENSDGESINGVLITSAINGSSIFFPAAGCMRDRTLANESLVVYYWAYYSLRYSTDVVCINEYTVSTYNDDVANRNVGNLETYFVSGKGTSCYGQPVRPVAD